MKAKFNPMKIKGGDVVVMNGNQDAVRFVVLGEDGTFGLAVVPESAGPKERAQHIDRSMVHSIAK